MSRHSDREPERGDDRRFLSQTDAEALLARYRQFVPKGVLDLPLEIVSWWTGELRWGRNRASLASDRRDVYLVSMGTSTASNQVDDASLEAMAKRNTMPRDYPFKPPRPPLPKPQPTLWSDATYNLTAEARAEVARALIEPAEAKGLLSAGYLEVRAGSRLWTVNGEQHYARYTQAQCSMTVRDPQGTGSGWAGASSYDWAKLDPKALAQRALEKCLASQNPVALEPGRYTVILEPQAVADLLEPLVRSFWRWDAETMGGPFALREGFSKLGLKVIDERLTLSHDPADPMFGIVSEPGTAPVAWIDHGVLANLYYDRDFGVGTLNEDLPVRSPALSYRLSGGDTSIDEMVATTKRGLLVTRLWGIDVLDNSSLLSTGLTRDGLWLIENGKITKPAKNFRFTESSLFALNQLDQLGVPVPVFRPVRDPAPDQNNAWRYAPYFVTLTPAVVPPLKIRDFNFTAMADAV